ncbi:(R)-limonene synthase 1, chloroplastic-like [Neltuma alba]|uniref:(R)-limonene synthase 1, chloroplastic-like n=1 Tax=Neltuma alba TaxID=207710 RepID=UPI0010A30F1D|nr:(R)-limonene synthase 1, chloroplastic-like [Prosopis alba]
MALHLPQAASLPFGSLTKMLPLNKTSSSVSAISKSFNATTSLKIQCKAPSVIVSDQSQQVSRRSGDFKPDVWHYDYIKSLDNNYKEHAYEEESRMLRAEVRVFLSDTVNPLQQLELIDTLQRLGLAYHFKSEINKMLENIYSVDKFKNKQNLHATALEFRLSRQHGYDIPTVLKLLELFAAADVFDSFINDEDETILEKATDFTSKSLRDFMSRNPGHELTSQVKHAMEVPLHWRLPRWEARWFISEYERMPNMNSNLLQLAKLDYNMLQAMYQEEVKSNIRWWERTGLEEKINFYRCRVVDNYLWGLGMKEEPHVEKLRRVIGNLCAIITLTDDMYDVHGTLDELELFTEAILSGKISVRHLGLRPDGTMVEKRQA